MSMTRDGILAIIAEDPRLRELKREVERRMAENPFQDPGHDLFHFIRVALWTIRLGQGRLDPACAIAAALLHDIVNVPKNSPDRSRASELSAQVAREILPRYGFSTEEIQEIAEAVRDHSFSRGAVPQRQLGKCLQDADRLESLGSIGLMRLISTGCRMGAQYFDPADPWAKKRDLDDLRYSTDHFFTKIFKLPETMNTAAGKKEALHRAQQMRAFLEQLGEELGDPL